jgi:hypothetical protein
LSGRVDAVERFDTRCEGFSDTFFQDVKHGEISVSQGSIAGGALRAHVRMKGCPRLRL